MVEEDDSDEDVMLILYGEKLESKRPDSSEWNFWWENKLYKQLKREISNFFVDNKKNQCLNPIVWVVKKG